MKIIKTMIQRECINRFSSKDKFSFNGASKLFLCVLTILSCTLICNQVMAQQFDQSYLKWKAEQQAQDARLKKVDEQYYLSRPAVTNIKGTPKSVNNEISSGSKIKLNSASVAELQQLSGVGEKKAQAIVEYRQKNGKFKSVNDLKNVKGIGPKLLEKNLSRLGL